jgi:hypothetical protein
MLICGRKDGRRFGTGKNPKMKIKLLEIIEVEKKIVEKCKSKKKGWVVK